MNKKAISTYSFLGGFIFLAIFLAGVINPSDVSAVSCRQRSTDPKWEIYDFMDCPTAGGGSQFHFCGTDRCNFCEGSAYCKSPSAGDSDPGCEVSCGGAGGGGGTPDKDMIWQRVFTDDFNGNVRYFGSSYGVPETVTSPDASNFKDARVNMRVRKEGSGDFLSNIWSGRFCALSPVISVDSWGRPRAVRENGETSEQADPCCTDNGNETLCDWSSFRNNFCTACRYDRNVSDDYCNTQDIDGCEQLSSLNPELYAKGSGVNQNDLHPMNKIFDIVSHQQNPPETSTRGMHPWQRYDRTYTVTTLNAVENIDHKALLTAPDGYFCYKAVILRRSDNGGFAYNDPRNFTVDPAKPDQSDCTLSVEPEGGGTYALWQVKKSIKGRVVGTDGTNVNGISGARVMFWVGNDSNIGGYQYLGETNTDANGNYFYNNSSLQDYAFYNVKVVSAAPVGYQPTAVAVKWDNPNATSGSISNTWTQSRDTNVGEDGYYRQATNWDNDCSSNKRDGTLQAGRCVFAFRKIMNKPPTCTIQYESSPGVYQPYDSSLEWAPNARIRMRTVASDPEGDFISSYSFGSTCGTLQFPSPTVSGDIYFFTPNTTSGWCNYYSDAADVGSGTRGPLCLVTVKTKAESAGAMLLASNSYLTKNSRTGYATATVINHYSATARNLVIQQTGICAPSVATCTFDATGGLTMPVPQGNSSNRITVTLKNPFGISRGGLHYISVLYEPGIPQPYIRTAALQVEDINPACQGITYGQTMPTNAANVQFRLGVVDDWSVSDLGVEIKDAVTNASASTILGLTPGQPYFATRNPVTIFQDSRQAPSSSTFFTWNTAGVPSGSYRVEATIVDTNGNQVTCPFNPLISLDKTAPTCTNLRITNAISPSDASPLQISSNARDTNSRIRKVRYIVAPASAGDINLANSATWKYNQEFLMSNFASQVPGSQQTFTTPLNNSWITNNNLRGLYTVYAQWEDEAGNVPNGTGGCKIDFELGTRYRVKVQVPSDNASGVDYATSEVGGTDFKFIARRNAEAWPVALNVSRVGTFSSNCTAVYPDGNGSNDHGQTCGAYFLTNTVFGNGNTSNIGIQIPKYNGVRKYSCDAVTVNGTTYTRAAGQLTIQTIAGLDYCVLNGTQFPVTQGTYPTDANVAAAYPTQVDFKLAYNTDAVAGRLFDKNGVNVSNREITSKLQGPPVINGPNATSFGAGPSRYFIVPGGSPLDSGKFWPVNPANSQFSPVFSITKVASDDEMCFYTALSQPTAADIIAAQPPLPKVTYDEISNLIRTRDVASVLRFNDSCTVSDLTGSHGKLSPLYQNQISMLISPRMRIGTVPVTFVDEIANCNQPGTAFPASFDVKAIVTDSTTGAELANCEIDQPACQTAISNITLNFKHNYSVMITMSNAPVTLSDFVICDEKSQSRTNPYVFSPVDNTPKPTSYFNDDNNDYGIKYPKIPAGNDAIITPIKFALKENNKWYQVYNGGVHDNSKLSLSSNTDPNTEGMPSLAVLVGDPTGVTPVPKGYDMYSALPASNPTIAGGLVSSYDYDPESFGQFGLTGIPNVDNWHTVDMVKGTNKLMQFDNSIVSVFQAVKNNATAGSGILGYSVVNSLSNALTTNKSYYSASGTETLNSTLDYSGVAEDSVATFIDFSDGSEVTDASGDSNNVLVISSNIVTRSDQSLIIFVNGNVEVDYDVTKLNSVTIVSTGVIKYTSKGEDQDVEIDVRGAMYGKLVVFDRDLDDSGLNLNPAERILYDNRLVNFSKDENFATEITESRIYWILKE